MPIQRIPLVGSPVFRNSDVSNSISKDQHFENCFPEAYKNQLTGQGSVYLVKRPGFAKTQIAGVGYDTIGASFVWSGYSGGPVPLFAYYSGANVAVYEVNTNGLLSGSTFAGPAGTLEFSETLVSNTATLVATGKLSALECSAWYYQNGGSWTQITDFDYPGRPVSGGGLG